MSARDRVVQIIGETITAEVERMAFSQIVGDTTACDQEGHYAVDVEKIAETVAGRLESEGLI